jgi:hypothetical protein
LLSVVVTVQYSRSGEPPPTSVFQAIFLFSIQTDRYRISLIFQHRLQVFQNNYCWYVIIILVSV